MSIFLAILILVNIFFTGRYFIFIRSELVDVDVRISNLNDKIFNLSREICQYADYETENLEEMDDKLVSISEEQQRCFGLIMDEMIWIRSKLDEIPDQVSSKGTNWDGMKDAFRHSPKKILNGDI